MKLTAGERNLWLIVLIVAGGILVYRFCLPKQESVTPDASGEITLNEARRLLRTAPNITARHQATADRLMELERRYLKGSSVEQMRIDLLEKVEDMALQSSLKVERKNVIDYPDNTLGVVLEGTSTSESVFRFMYQAATAPVGFRLKRIQMNSNLELKVLKYQLIVVAKLTGYREGKP